MEISDKIKDRFEKIGASEVAGLVRHYAPTLHEKGLIDEEMRDKLLDIGNYPIKGGEIGNYLQTPYSLYRLSQLSLEELQTYQNWKQNLIMTSGAKKAQAGKINRGNDLERKVLDDYLNESTIPIDYQVVSWQKQYHKIIKGLAGTKDIDFICTLDFVMSEPALVNQKIHEIKTTAINLFNKVHTFGVPFEYVIQVNMQMWASAIRLSMIHIAGVETIKQDDGTLVHQILDRFDQEITYDERLVKATLHAVAYWKWECETRPQEILNKPDELKTKVDKEIDNFLRDIAGTKEETITTDLKRVVNKVKRLKLLKDEYDKLDKELKAEIKTKIGEHKFLHLKDKQGHLIIEAKYTTPSVYDEDEINKAILKAMAEVEIAKTIQPGDLKSDPQIRYTIKTITYSGKNDEKIEKAVVSAEPTNPAIN